MLQQRTIEDQTICVQCFHGSLYITPLFIEVLEKSPLNIDQSSATEVST